MRRIQRGLALATLTLTASALPVAVCAQSTPDPVGIQVVSAGHGKLRATIVAGPSGAPGGFVFWWMPASEFASYGDVWPEAMVGGEGWGKFTGGATLNSWGEDVVPFALAPGQALDVEVGDLFDETGVRGVIGELPGGTNFVLCAYALGASGADPGPLSATLQLATTPQGLNCTYTQGFWKTHPTAWPVSSVSLGSVSYLQSQALQILGAPAAGNGLLSLAHQLIAAKLNVAAGADGSAIAATLSAADAMIGALVVPPVGAGSLQPAATSALTQALDDYNNGLMGPGHCGLTPARAETWGSLKSRYR